MLISTLTIVFLLAIITVKSQCPKRCSCEYKRIICNGKYGTDPLKFLPINIPNDTLELFVAYNEISSLETELHMCPSLVILDISSNKLTNIVQEALKPLGQLQSLVLGRNQITSRNLRPEIFLNKPHLTFLDLSSNQLGPILYPNLFVSLNQLVMLLLEGNKITDMPSRSLAGLQSLQVLVLRDNWLTNVPTEAWKYVPNLQELDISDNNISAINAHAFKGLDKTKELDLVGESHLQVIKRYAFTGMESLEIVRIQHCKRLILIETGAFKNVKYLREVHLQRNALTSLPGDIIQWNALSRLFLSDNPWHCDCRLQWMSKVLRNRDLVAVNKEHVTCWSPESLANDMIARLPQSSFKCPKAIFTKADMIKWMVPAALIALVCTIILSLLSIKLHQMFFTKESDMTVPITYGTVQRNSIIGCKNEAYTEATDV